MKIYFASDAHLGVIVFIVEVKIWHNGLLSLIVRLARIDYLSIGKFKKIIK